MKLLGQLRQQKVLSTTLLAFTLSIGILIGTLINTAVHAEKAQGGARDASTLVIPNPVQLSTAFSALAKQLEPSVVNISTTYRPKAPTNVRGNRRPQAAPPEEDDQGDPEGRALESLHLHRR